MTNENKQATTSLSTTLTLVFGTTEELQTRLVLLPRVEEQGVGAIVDTYVPLVDGGSAAETTKDVHGTVVEAILVDDANSVDLKDLEFSEILAALRSASPPVRLQLSYRNDDEAEKIEQETSVDVDDIKVQEKVESTFEEEKKVDPADIVAVNDKTEPNESEKPERIEDPAPSMQHSLMSWATRLSATSVQMATERAQQAMEVAAERRKAAAAVMASSIPPTLRSRTLSAETKENAPILDVDLFIQTSSGAFLPLPKEKQRQSSELRVTNASLLTIRKSAAEACSPRAYSFQWFRSVERKNTSCDGATIDWVELPGATSRTFQPTATEVGHRIRCVVEKLDGDESESDDEEEEYGNEVPSSRAVSATVGTHECVSAALALFNGARQALINGAQFGGMSGQGNAKGRTFRIKVAMLISKDPETKKSRSTSSLCIYQVSGSTSEPIHPEEEPITGITGEVDHESAKDFELILPEDMPESASMVAALATDGRLKLSASNRLGRESLLLSIGIANYTGEPSTLGPCSVLYCDAETPGEEKPPLDEATELCNPVENDEEPVQEDSTERPPLVPKKNESMQRSVSMDGSSLMNESDSQRMKEMERELNALRSKLSKKDKALAEAQKQAKTSESANAKLREDLLKKEGDLKETKRNLLVAERRMQSQGDDMKRMRSDHTKAVESLNKELDSRTSAISELEKTVRTLQNEKAVLSATVEARDSKLTKMAELQSSLEEMKKAAARTDGLRSQLQQASQKYESLAEQLQTAEGRERQLRRQCEDARERILSLEEMVKVESKKAESCRAELDTQQMKIQKLKAERNSYKQKSDSLSKEIARVCRQGRTIKEVEKIISDDAARRQEVELLREQKRKALEDLNHYRTSFEQSRAAQRLAGLDHETSKVYERNAELERLLSELTEYVSAKEMQLDTLKEINDALQEEIKELHRAQMSKNLGKNDV